MTRSELTKVEVVIQNLSSIVKNGARRLGDNLLQGHRFELCPSNHLVEVVNVGLKVLAVMERQRLITNHRSQGLVGQINQGKHRTNSITGID